MVKASVAINKCTRCMKKKPKVIIVTTGMFGEFSLKQLCENCYGIQKEEGTLHA